MNIHIDAEFTIVTVINWAWIISTAGLGLYVFGSRSRRIIEKIGIIFFFAAGILGVAGLIWPDVPVPYVAAFTMLVLVEFMVCARLLQFSAKMAREILGDEA